MVLLGEYYGKQNMFGVPSLRKSPASLQVGKDVSHLYLRSTLKGVGGNAIMNSMGTLW